MKFKIQNTIGVIDCQVVYVVSSMVTVKYASAEMIGPNLGSKKSKQGLGLV